MATRKEKTARLRTSSRIRTTVISTVIVLITVVLIGLNFTIFHKRDITEIEKAMPQDSSAVFISSANNDSWSYMNRLAGIQTPFPADAQYVGYALSSNTPVLYFSTPEDKVSETKKWLDNSKTDYIQKDYVFALTKDSSKLAESGIGNDSSYASGASKSAQASSGYINFGSLSKNANDTFVKVLPSAGKWYGEFKQNQWVGKISDVDFSKVDAVTADEEKFKNPKFNDFMKTFEYTQTGDNKAVGSFNISLANDLMKEPVETGLQKVDFEINSNQLMFTIQ